MLKIECHVKKWMENRFSLRFEVLTLITIFREQLYTNLHVERSAYMQTVCCFFDMIKLQIIIKLRTTQTDLGMFCIGAIINPFSLNT